MVLAYRYFQHFEYLIFVIVFFLVYRCGQYKRNYMKLCVYIRVCSCMLARLIQVAVVSEQLHGWVSIKKENERVLPSARC